MRRKGLTLVVCLLLGLFVFVTLGSGRAFGDRVWDGKIHFVDAKMILDFHGYDSGTWEDLRALRIYAHKGNTAGPTSVSFRLVADEDNPLLATYVGKIRLVVDQKEAEVKELRFVRESQNGGWKVDPRIIDAIEESEADGK